ncbi:hypothetical protein BJ085DRAFT_2448, partial [Dimargaris cristalligena]
AEKQTAALKRRLLEWAVFPYDLTEDDLLRCIYIIIKDALACSHLHMPDNIVQNFILTIHNSYYNTNAYHNFHHAVDVLQAAYYFMKTSQLMDIGRDASAATKSLIHRSFHVHDILALIIAAIGHDIGHPGVNNGFMTACRSPLATLYQDKAVLEHFHATALCQIMKRCGFDIARYNPGFNEAEFRYVMVETILATDMAAHFDYIEKFRQLKSRCTVEAAALRRNSVTVSQQSRLTDRVIICSMLIKCADISNVTRPFHVAGSWTNLLNEEMGKQSDLERKLGYPVSMVISPETSARSQVGFYRGMALPLFEAAVDLFPSLDFTRENLLENIKTWEQIQEEQDRRLAAQNEQR